MGECLSLPVDTLSISSSSQLLLNGGHGLAALRCLQPPSHSSILAEQNEFTVSMNQQILEF
jgi:hypothetical protein